MSENVKNDEAVKKEIGNSINGFMGCFILILLLCFGFWTCSPSSEEAFLYDKDSLAYIKIKDSVSKLLVSPSTADFPFYPESSKRRGKKHFYIISSYVDSQNKLGASIRTNFTATAEYLGDIKDDEYEDTYWNINILEIDLTGKVQ